MKEKIKRKIELTPFFSEESVKQAFQTLWLEIQKQVEYLDKKPGLSKEEKKIRDKLQEALKVSERAIRREIKDVKKELK